jgi:ACS family tartrate transporter-like MFS transporter
VTPSEITNTSDIDSLHARALYRKISWRLIPYLFLLYIVAYVDRVNVGFAAMDMKRQLGFSDTVYGTGAGIFFLGYALFDMPSNLVLQRVGTRLWIARIMITWGLIASCMTFIHSAGSFYALRFLLGVGEAGFVPGMLLYLTYWFPSHERARAVAWFMTATSLAGVVGGPLSSALLQLDGLWGLHGWQWLFIAEGIPTILLGISVLFVLKDGPGQADWLTGQEQRWLTNELEQDRARYGATKHHAFADAFRLPAVWMLAFVYVSIQIGVYIVNLWMPLMLDSLSSNAGHDASMIARFSTLPYLLAALFTVAIGWSSDCFNERSGHLAGCMALAAVGFAWAAMASSVAIALCAFCLAAMGLWSTMGPFWALMTRTVAGTAAAAGVALITTLGGFGGFLGPYITGRLREATHSFSHGLYAVSILALIASLVSIATRQLKEQPSAC